MKEPVIDKQAIFHHRSRLGIVCLVIDFNWNKLMKNKKTKGFVNIKDSKVELGSCNDFGGGKCCFTDPKKTYVEVETNNNQSKLTFRFKTRDKRFKDEESSLRLIKNKRGKYISDDLYNRCIKIKKRHNIYYTYVVASEFDPKRDLIDSANNGLLYRRMCNIRDSNETPGKFDQKARLTGTLADK